MKQWAVAVAFAVGLSAGGSAAFAADPGVAAEIELLKERLASLEQKLAQQEARSVGAAPESAIIQLPSGIHGIEMSGFVDTAYSYNFNEPRDEVNDGRIFDTTANSFVLHNFQLNIQKAADLSSPLGFKTVLMFGDDAEAVHSTGLFVASDAIDVQQAYIEYLADIGEGVTLTFGKQATLIGAEVIESIDNWNYSRSFLFGLAIPFTHTGFRASYPLSETVSIAAGVNNGWDIADDANIGKGVEGQIAWAPTDDFSISLQGMFSPETNITADADRWIADIVASYQVNEDLALMLNYDFGYEEDNIALNDNAGWQGLGAYAKYTISDTWSLAGRYEFFRDYDGFRTGAGLGATAFSGTVGTTAGTTDLSLQEITLTSEHLIKDRLIARLEYRHDIANAKVFGHDDTGLTNYQDTLAVQLIYPF